VRTLAAGGTTVLYTTHYMEEAAKLCDRVGIIDHGRMLDVGTVPELLARHGGTAGEASDLESAFLALTGRSLRE
jgi:ABC-2 type transport system ATP-binding protein